MMNKYIQVMTTVETRKQADELAEHVLNLRLAGCVQILSCSSSYHWQGKIEQSQEFLCVIKTREDMFHELQAAIEQVHPYEVAEIIATEIIKGNNAYFDWLGSELGR